MNGVYIEITDVCNLHCSFCPCGKRNTASEKSKVSAPRTFMGSELFERCISEAATVTEQVYFHMLGEPTLHPGFGLYLKKLEQASAKRTDGKKLQLTLTTNGTTIERIGKAILASPAVRQVNFSTHAYAELSTDTAQQYLQNVLDFCRMAQAIRPDLYINLRLWNVGDESSHSWNAYMLEQVNQAFGRTDATDTEHAPLTLEHFCSRHKSFIVKGRIYIHQDSRFEWPEKDERGEARDERVKVDEKIPRGTCRALDTHVAILHDGRVVACCLDYSGQITLGHIQQNTLSEILESPLAADIKEGFARHELRHPFCQSCTFCKRFK